jgi:hypothetical protein
LVVEELLQLMLVSVMLAFVREHGLEGIGAKRADSVYQPDVPEGGPGTVTGPLIQAQNAAAPIPTSSRYREDRRSATWHVATSPIISLDRIGRL